MNDSQKKDDTLLIARQPILDVAGRLVAYELLFRNPFDEKFHAGNASALTMSVVADSLGELGLDGTSNGKDCFLNCPDDFLFSPTMNLLPPDRFVLEVMEYSNLGMEIYAACEQFRKKGFRIALDDITDVTSAISKMLPVIDVAKIDWKDADPAKIKPMCQLFTSRGITVLAEKVESWDDYRVALDAGATLFQGYYFSRPQVISSRRVSPSAKTVVEVMQLLLDDAHHSKIADSLLRVPSLLAQLLRLASSSALPGLNRSSISSVHDALRLVGSDRLMQWCGLLLYLDRLPTEDDPLALLAMQRSQWMGKYISDRHPNDDYLKQQAEMIGSLSLLHVAYQCDVETFWREISLGGVVRTAIMEEHGVLGQALAAVKRMEASL